MIGAETVKEITLEITLAKNRAKIQIKDKDNSVNNFNVTSSNLHNYNDFDIDRLTEGRIDDLSQSNIGVQINNHPFSFYLYRKDTKERLFDTTHSSESREFNHYLYYAKKYIQLSTRLPNKHYTYGLGERFTSLRLKKGKYVMWASDSNNGGPAEKEGMDSSYSSMPGYITVSPITQNAYGAYMINSSPMEVTLSEEYLTYKMTSGIVEFYVFYGPRPKEVIMQMQKTFGMPILAPYSALNFQANVISSGPARDLIFLADNYKNDTMPFEGLWIDYSTPVTNKTYEGANDAISKLNDNGINIYRYKRSALSKTSPHFETAKNSSVCIKQSASEKNDYIGKTSYGDVCYIDYLSPNALQFIKNTFISSPDYNYNNTRVTLLLNEPYNNNPNVNSDNHLNLPFIPGEKDFSLERGTIPITSSQNGENNIMLNTHNIYSLQEVRTYYTALVDLGIPRPLIFSRSSFPGAQQYAGKWLGYISDTWLGLKMSIVQTLNFNVIF